MERVERKYYPDGTLQEEVHYLGNREHGPWRRWHPNGVLAEEYWFDRGVYENCVARTWFTSGALKSEVAFVNGRQSGRATVFAEDGSVIDRYYALDGKKVSRNQYDRACESRPELQKYADEIDNSPRGQQGRGWKRQAHKTANQGKQDDRQFIGDLLKSRTAEARGWLIGDKASAERNNLGELGTDLSLRLVEQLYTLGAIVVLAVNIDSIPGEDVETTDDILVRLPGHGIGRASLFEFENRHAAEQGFDGVVDQGQEYLYFKLA